MKKLLSICIIALSFAMMPQQMEAQGLLKKINKGLEKVNKVLDKAKPDATVAPATADVTTATAEVNPVAEVSKADGVVVLNPLKNAVDVELVGAYGVSTSENWGNVELILKVKMHNPLTKILLGGDLGQKGTMAFDADGNVYKMFYPTVGSDFDVIEGLAVRIVLNGNNAFQKVSKKVDVFPIVKLFAHLTYDIRDEITFKNVPVQWDVEH